MPQKRYEYIDALRGLAIILVILNHIPEALNYSIELPKVLDSILGQGARGVQLFYIISAYTIYLTYSKRINKEQSPILNFYIRRFFRIAPLFYICLLFYSFRMYFFNEFGVLTLGKVISAITFTNGFHPDWINGIVPGGWSIAIEMVFYLITPIIFFYVNDLKKAIAFLIISLIFAKRLSLLLLKFHIIDNDNLGYLFLYLPTQIPYFMMGIIFYFLTQQQETPFLTNKEKRKWGRIFFILIIFLFVSFCIDGIDMYFPWHFFYALCLFCLTYCLYTYPNKLIVNPFFIYFGKISYSVYLIHFSFFPLMPIIKEQIPFTTPTGIFLIIFCTFIIMSLIFGTISYKLVERPCVNFVNQLVNKRENL